jgi:hypothetical protein
MNQALLTYLQVIPRGIYARTFSFLSFRTIFLTLVPVVIQCDRLSMSTTVKTTHGSGSEIQPAYNSKAYSMTAVLQHAVALERLHYTL